MQTPACNLRDKTGTDRLPGRSVPAVYRFIAAIGGLACEKAVMLPA